MRGRDSLGADLIKVSLLPVQDGVGCGGAFQVRHQVIHFPLEPLLGFLQGGAFGAHCLCVFLCFLEPLGQFFPKKSKIFFSWQRWTISELTVRSDEDEQSIRGWNWVRTRHRMGCVDRV